jgi:hypothetical protein
VRAKCPRWLVPSCSSKPSVVVRCGVAITPALLTSTSMLRSRPSAKARTAARSARSSAPNLGVAAQPGRCALALRGVANRERDVCSRRGELPCRGEPDPAVGAGDHEAATPLTGHLGWRPGAHGVTLRLVRGGQLGAAAPKEAGLRATPAPATAREGEAPGFVSLATARRLREPGRGPGIDTARSNGARPDSDAASQA